VLAEREHLEELELERRRLLDGMVLAELGRPVNSISLSSRPWIFAGCAMSWK
jgi:hypothetical protein